MAGDLTGRPPLTVPRHRGEPPPWPWTWLHQVHGNGVVVVSEPGQHAGAAADAAVTSTPGCTLAVRSADCAPVVLLGAHSVGLVHAGWRGLVAGVVSSAVEAMRALGDEPEQAHLGPCIRPGCYEFSAADLDEVAARLGAGVRATTSRGQPGPGPAGCGPRRAGRRGRRAAHRPLRLHGLRSTLVQPPRPRRARALRDRGVDHRAMSDPTSSAACHEQVAAALDRARSRIAEAGGDPRRVRVLAVTKGQPVGAVRAALDAGLLDVGESYAQELLAKADALEPLLGALAAPRWHLIGRLQRNKVRHVAPFVQLWQSVDRLSLAAEVARHAPGAAVLVQVNVSGAEQQGGCRPEQAAAVVEGCGDLGLDVRGVMAIGPRGPSADVASAFAAVRALADRLELPERSMGMSGDLEEAVRAGSTMVRLGTRAVRSPWGSRSRGKVVSVPQEETSWLRCGVERCSTSGSGPTTSTTTTTASTSRWPRRCASRARRPAATRPSRSRRANPTASSTSGRLARCAPSAGPAVRPQASGQGGDPSARPRTAVVRPLQPVASAKPHVVAPTSFNHAQEVADKLKVSPAGHREPPERRP